jgi:hypothetical protein
LHSVNTVRACAHTDTDTIRPVCMAINQSTRSTQQRSWVGFVSPRTHCGATDLLRTGSARQLRKVAAVLKQIPHGTPSRTRMGTELVGDGGAEVSAAVTEKRSRLQPTSPSIATSAERKAGVDDVTDSRACISTRSVGQADGSLKCWESRTAVKQQDEGARPGPKRQALGLCVKVGQVGADAWHSALVNVRTMTSSG